MVVKKKIVLIKTFYCSIIKMLRLSNEVKLKKILSVENLKHPKFSRDVSATFSPDGGSR